MGPTQASASILHWWNWRPCTQKGKKNPLRSASKGGVVVGKRGGSPKPPTQFPSVRSPQGWHFWGGRGGKAEMIEPCQANKVSKPNTEVNTKCQGKPM